MGRRAVRENRWSTDLGLAGDTRGVVDRVRVALRVEGVVQGVGFRPFVHNLATRLGLSGHVGNDAAGVFVEVEGSREATDVFLRAVPREAPRLAQVDDVVVTNVEPVGSTGFAILPSRSADTPSTLVSADTATCDECLSEMWDTADRRYRYPFLNCTNCGPRFTIVRRIPYDRARTTMSVFAMCAQCRAEYEDPADRRFHAQPVCCPVCGPRLSLSTADGEVPGDPLVSAVARLHDGQVVAVKGLGGYHLAALAGDDRATSALRDRKDREEKPFAVMVPSVEVARTLCEVDGLADGLLRDPRRPIVLLPRVADAPVARSAAPGNRHLGLMLPYTPLHHLLLAEVGAPLVLTSANVSDEPIVYRDDALGRLDRIADAFLTHDRPIHIRTDDSVVRPFRGQGRLQRRSRGYVPTPVRVRDEFAQPVLACGAELKNTFCIGTGRHAFLSQHIGDLENFETLMAFRQSIDHFQHVFDVRPRVVAHDLHPEYLSTKYAHELEATARVRLVGVQHHHAHIAACLADNGEQGPVVGVAFDGLGYGTDGTIWGGEFLLADLAGFRRVGHLAPVPMPGGSTAIRQPWRMTAAYLDTLGMSGLDDLGVVQRHRSAWADVVSVARAGVGSPPTSSAGRLFDAVAAMLDVRDTISYEGQAAIELEQLADPHETGSYRVRIDEGEPLVAHGGDLLAACVDDLRAGVSREQVAARFHNGAADLIVRTCTRLGSLLGVRTVALSGGVFQNLLLLEAAVRSLEAAGMRVLTHARVPTNDGGVSLGQAMVASTTLHDSSVV